jgi:cobyrinic acid a,c-diamide synthase
LRDSAGISPASLFCSGRGYEPGAGSLSRDSVPVVPADPPSFSALVLAGTHSGVGKTTVTLGLIGALRRRGLVVQPFKVGPDFIDPLHHQHATGRPPRNLDGWMLDPDVNRERFARFSADADAALVEGVMGVFDGKEGGSERGSTAEMAKLLGLPVVLVIDAGAMARSAAALIHGFTSFDPDLHVAGVILNNIGSPTHAQMIHDAVAGAVPILGALPRVRDLVVPERHLGLHLPHEGRARYLAELTDLVEANINLEAVLDAAAIERPPASSSPVSHNGASRVRIGVARDEAFCFYYEDNLELLRDAGAELVEFSPIRDPLPADLDGLYIGGGYPELYAPKLERNVATREAIRKLAAGGAPIYAECGGLMYVAETLLLGDEHHPMCGVLALRTRMPARLTLTYVQITTTGGLFGPGQTARGHMYHHSEIDGEPELPCCYRVLTSRGQHLAEGYRTANVLASYAHLHFAANPSLAARFVEACHKFREAHRSLAAAP